MGNILKHKIDKDFTVVSNQLLRAKLSTRATGLFLQIISLPEGWNFSIKGLSQLFTDKEYSIKAGIDELVEAGFLIWERHKGPDGRYVVTVTTMYPDQEKTNNDKQCQSVESQSTKEPYGKNPCGYNPCGNDPYGSNQGNIIYNNKELNNKELNNKLGTEESAPEIAQPSKEIVKKQSTDEAAKAYYETIKMLKLPVRNHNNVRAKINQLKQELGEEDSLKYLQFIINIYPTLPDDGFKPRILEALDIYSKRVAIGSWVTNLRDKQSGGIAGW